MNILIVEDDKDILSFLKKSLKSDGFVVDSAENGSLGLQKAKGGDYDLIILDNILPNKNGMEICSEIRTAGKNTRILMLSVGAEVDVKVQALKRGADDYLTKPFSYKELSARIEALMRRPVNTKNNILQVVDLTLDKNSHIVKRGKKQIKLTSKEFSLLEYLMHKKGQAVSKTNILEHVFDINADLNTNKVQMHVMNLRKKIKDKGKNQLIHTVSGLGYKIF